MVTISPASLRRCNTASGPRNSELAFDIEVHQRRSGARECRSEKNSMPSPIWRPALGFVAAATDLYRQGDICSTYFVVLSCWIALSVLLDDGSCQILDFALPGAVLGLQSTQNTPMYHSARCLSIARVFAFPHHKLDTIVENNSRLAVLLCRQIASDEARAHDHLANLGLRGARERIAHFLLEIYVRLQRHLPNKPGETLHLPLSQAHIGQALGLTYVHVSRTLHILREQKVVRFANQNSRNH